MTIATGAFLGPYEILAPLGAGGMGEVYRARDTRLGRDVAVKVLPAAFASDPDRLRRFEHEARAAGQLNHPNILVIHDVGVHEGVPYLVSELLEGETLRARLGGGPLPPRKSIEIALQIARGLGAAHEGGLVHRDLKPENLFVLRDGRVKILDFGIAKLTRPEGVAGAGGSATAASQARSAPTATVDTNPGMVMGTAGYMAPEQVRGQPADHRADIFALGAILYEMLAGRRAFRGDTSAETMTAILREEPPEISREGRPVPPALDRIVRHCLEKSPHERFQSASDVAFALEALSGISDSGPKPAVAAGRPGAWRRFLVPALAALAILALGALAIRQLAGRASGRPVEYRKLTFRRGPIQFARFGADGRTVYYSASWEDGRPTLYSCDLSTPGALKVGAPDSSWFLAASPSNELAILLRYRGRPHDLAVGTLARMAPGGAPREILDNVAVADWNPDGTDLAVVHVVGNRYRLEYPIGTVLYDSPGWISHLRVSPDGKSVAFLDHPVFPDDRGSVWIASPGKRARSLGGDFTTTQGLAWSPSGKEIWFAAATSGSSRSIYAVDLRGKVRVVASLPGSGRVQDVSAAGDALLANDDISVGIRGRAPGEREERDLSWLDWSIPTAFSRDGRTLLFDEDGVGGGEHYSVCIRGTDGSPAVRLGEGSSEDLSPDGKWALTTRFWLRPPELWLLPTGPGQPHKLAPTGLENISSAGFLPSGRQILVIGNEPGHPTRAYVHEIAGGSLLPVTPEGIYARRNYISPDGRWALGVVGGGDAHLYPLDGGRPRDIPGKRPEENIVGWSADGTSLYVAALGQRPAVVYRLALANGARARWEELKGPEDRAGTLIGATIVGRDDHTYAYAVSRNVSELYLARGLR